jgi:hypothetical protein
MTDAALKTSRGPAFTGFEDLLICKAFIAASEDPTVGTYQKGGTFQVNMHRIYCNFLDEHEKISSSLFESVPSSHGQVIPATFNRRTNKSIYERFKNVISPRVSKFIAITEVAPRESGKNDQDFYEQCKMLYTEQTTYGDFEPFKNCYEYLIKKPKYASWRDMQDPTTGKVKKERPMGSKRAKEAQAVKEVARKILVEEKRNKIDEDTASIKANDMRHMMENFNSFMEMKMMREMGAGLSKEDIDSLETPDRKAYRKAKVELMIIQMNEMVAKRRRLAFAEASSSSASPLEKQPGSNTTSNTTTATTTANNSDDDNSEVDPGECNK